MQSISSNIDWNLRDEAKGSYLKSVASELETTGCLTVLVLHLKVFLFLAFRQFQNLHIFLFSRENYKPV